jgi:hypothetical protein
MSAKAFGERTASLSDQKNIYQAPCHMTRYTVQWYKGFADHGLDKKSSCMLCRRPSGNPDEQRWPNMDHRIESVKCIVVAHRQRCNMQMRKIRSTIARLFGSVSLQLLINREFIQRGSSSVSLKLTIIGLVQGSTKTWAHSVLGPTQDLWPLYIIAEQGVFSKYMRS